MRSVDVLVVGAGPAGLAVAARLAAGGGRVEVVEREQAAGGVPRHCGHGGFGGGWLTGPEYARRAVEAAVRAGAVVRTGVTVLDWVAGAGVRTGVSVVDGVTGGRPGVDVADGVGGAGVGLGADVTDGVVGEGVFPGVADRVTGGVAGLGSVVGASSLAVETTGPRGPERIGARAVVLATGARERPRSARLVPGTRPAGVLTTGELQQTVHLLGLQAGRRAVVVGAEPVSFHAAAALRRSGTDVVAIVTDLPRAQAPRARALDARLRHGVPLLTGATVTGLYGRGRLSGVGLRHRDGRSTTLACDTVVFTGDFVPEHELARRGALDIDPGTRGPAVDAAFRTSRRGVFAVGNLLHAVESAGDAAGEGTYAASRVEEFLASDDWPSATRVPIEVDRPLRWVAPNRIASDAAYDRLVLRTTRFLPRPHLLVTQDGRYLHSERHWRTAVPNRPVHLSADWAARVDAGGGAVRISVAG